jgi:hypothetical protein
MFFPKDKKKKRKDDGDSDDDIPSFLLAEFPPIVRYEAPSSKPTTSSSSSSSSSLAPRSLVSTLIARSKDNKTKEEEEEEERWMKDSTTPKKKRSKKPSASAGSVTPPTWNTRPTVRPLSLSASKKARPKQQKKEDTSDSEDQAELSTTDEEGNERRKNETKLKKLMEKVEQRKLKEREQIPPALPLVRATRYVPPSLPQPAPLSVPGVHVSSEEEEEDEKMDEVQEDNNSGPVDEFLPELASLSLTQDANLFGVVFDADRHEYWTKNKEQTGFIEVGLSISKLWKYYEAGRGVSLSDKKKEEARAKSSVAYIQVFLPVVYTHYFCSYIKDTENHLGKALRGNSLRERDDRVARFRQMANFCYRGMYGKDMSSYQSTMSAYHVFHSAMLEIERMLDHGELPRERSLLIERVVRIMHFGQTNPKRVQSLDLLFTDDPQGKRLNEFIQAYMQFVSREEQTKKYIETLFAYMAKKSLVDGTALHDFMDAFLKEPSLIQKLSLPETTDKYNILQFFKEYFTELTSPQGGNYDYVGELSETSLYSPDHIIAGRMDICFRHRDTGQYLLMDYKRSKGVMKEILALCKNRSPSTRVGCPNGLFYRLENVRLNRTSVIWEYSFQLGGYRKLLILSKRAKQRVTVTISTLVILIVFWPWYDEFFGNERPANLGWYTIIELELSTLTSNCRQDPDTDRTVLEHVENAFQFRLEELARMRKQFRKTGRKFIEAEYYERE